MDKTAFLWMLIEAIVFLVPIATLFIKLGRLIERTEKMEEKVKDLPQWRATMNEKVATLELNDIQQNNTLQSINDNLVKISTQVQLLLDNRIKMENN
jgi:hypothetical protein